METPDDLYARLGLTKNASADDIRREYKKLALRTHPDKVPAEQRDSATKRFKDISEAYQTLSDPEKRKQYDTYGTTDPNQAFQPMSMDDLNNLFEQAFPRGQNPFGGIFSQIFGSMPQNGPGPRPGPSGSSSQDVMVKYPVNLKTCYLGKTATLKIQKSDRCDPCQGYGSSDAQDYTCSVCKGQGTVSRVTRTPFGQQVMMTACSACQGRKRTRGFKPCDACNGTGLIERSITQSVDIPAGSCIGERIRLSGQGGLRSGRQTEPNDIVLELVEAPNDDAVNFRRRNDGDLLDLEMDLVISLAEALCGFSRNALHIDNRIFEIASDKISAPNTVVKIPGEGLRKAYHSGDLYVVLKIIWPTSIPNKEAVWKGLGSAGEYRKSKM